MSEPISTPSSKKLAINEMKSSGRTGRDLPATVTAFVNQSQASTPSLVYWKCQKRIRCYVEDEGIGEEKEGRRGKGDVGRIGVAAYITTPRLPL